MNLDLSGKRAIVCGSSQGIGKASTIELALLGASITLVARDALKLKEVVDQLDTRRGQKHSIIVADFSRREELKEKINAFAKADVAHVLVNNTGGPPAGLAIDAAENDFMQAFSNHLLCNQIMVQALVPGMKSQRYGRTINIISTSVKIPIYGLGVSNAIRGAVANWSKTLSLELSQYGITVNNVLPGATLTGRLEPIIENKANRSGKTKEEITEEMVREIPVGRIADASEVAAAVAFLASPAAGYINGVNVPVDGGRTGSL